MFTPRETGRLKGLSRQTKAQFELVPAPSQEDILTRTTEILGD